MINSFQTASPSLQKLDPAKRVNYTFGLVMGAEEFLQTDTYFLEKHRLETRLLHGYGTVCGLNVTLVSAPALQVRVAPGWAINPQGQTMHVTQLMCVQVNDWLQANSQALQQYFGSAPATLQVCVVLCYRECETDVVPIPGEPCRSQADSTAPSRIAESFELKLCLDFDQLASPLPGSPPPGTAVGSLCAFRPSQVEDDAVRAFGALLREIVITDSGTGFLTLSQLLDLVRTLAQPVGSPPPGGPVYRIHTSDAPEFLRAALRVWATEVRPALPNEEPCGAPSEGCVLLAELTLTLNHGWFASGVTIDDSRRPFLVPTRLLQEVLLTAAGNGAGTAAAGYNAVAAGFFRNDGTRNGPVFNGLSAATQPNGEFLLSFLGYRNPLTTPGLNYIVKGTVQDTAAAGNPRAVIEVVGFETSGIRIRILNTAGAPLGAGFGFMVEVAQIGG